MAVNLVNLENVRKAHGTTVVLDDVSLGVADGERIGVVGRNGSGKSTLLRVLAGAERVDSGRVTQTGGLTVGRLAQRDDLPADATVLRAVTGDRVEYEWAGDARVRAVLDGLVRDLRGDALVGTLSGGERRRVALAALLVSDPTLLLLDEPTNHLDIEAVAWLARWLRSRRGALVVVTHDRWFLDEVCEQTWEVTAGAIAQYDGGYAAYVLARAERERQSAAGEMRRRNLLRKELAWLRRGPPARTSKPRFRIDAANALIADEPPPRDTVELQRFAAARLGKDVVDVEDVTVRLGDRDILRDVTWRLGPGDRVGVVGPNGAGKSTLLRTITGELAPASGRVRIGRTVVPAVLTQEVAEVDPTLRVLQAVEEVAGRVELGKGREATAGQLLERLGFAAERQWTPVGDLSGGERRRLQLLRLLMRGPNLLLLDEPTNDLDVDTLAEVEDVLDGWAGTLVVVSHDRWFLERVCDSLWAVPGDGSVRHLPGGVDDYLALRASAVAAASASADGSARPKGDSRAARKELIRIERRLERISREEETLHGAIADDATDYERVAELDRQLRALAAERDELEESWLMLAEDVS
ncbi:MAG TPA: ABC-F family ATP-binding cassette domain-containing protein [Mycobacteriales bacterium]|jgi:ATP-binding cassette subfamily F protein uup|nr:ABC-F family ATP-binding cassette domain-containing protein [Mycobacteriales bacterium]